MEIFLSTLTGESFPLAVEASADIGAVKEHIHKLRGLAPDTQRLILGPKLLEDDHSLASCGIQSGTTLLLLAIPRPQALLEVEVWPEQGLSAYSEHGVFADTCAYPATVVRACVSGATDAAANGLYSSTSRGPPRATPPPGGEEQEQDKLEFPELMRGSYALRWAERCCESPSGWYVFDQLGRLPRVKVEVQASVRCPEDPAMDGTYRLQEDGAFENGSFTLAWYDALETYDGMCFQPGWYVEGFSSESTTHVENYWWWPPAFVSTPEPLSTSLTSAGNSSLALCGNLSM